MHIRERFQKHTGEILKKARTTKTNHETKQDFHSERQDWMKTFFESFFLRNLVRFWVEISDEKRLTTQNQTENIVYNLVYDIVSL